VRAVPEPAVIVGSGDFVYAALPSWERLPAGWCFEEVAGVAADSRGRVFVFNRGLHPVMIFEADGTFVTAWGEGLFVRPHGLYIGPDDSVYCCDDAGHVVRKFTPSGQLRLTLGVPGQPSDTGATSMDFRTIRRAGPPFHYPTNLALSPSGEMYITDGYGNARVHRFTAEGRLVQSWGEPGSAPGQFHLPHGIAIDERGVIYVADRENSRVQLFSLDGEFLAAWTDVARPCQVFVDTTGMVYVAELGFRAGMWPGTRPPHPGATGGRLSIFAPDGRLLARWGGGERPTEPGDFFAPHGIWVDGRGDVYVGEVVLSGGGNRGIVPSTCHALQKFIRRTGS
jgi:DNA-binding beta-propeller fold protein YncE